MRQISWIEVKNELLLFMRNSFGSIFTLEFLKVTVPLLIGWEALPQLGIVPKTLIPPPSVVAACFYDLLINRDLMGHLGVSLLRFFLGFAVAVMLAVPIGIGMGWSVYIRKHLLPLFQLLAPIPPPAWVPLTIIALGIGLRMQGFLVFLGVFYPVLFNTYMGVKETNRRFINTSRLFGASEFTTLIEVALPSSLASIVMGTKIGISMGLVCLVISEMFGASGGLGWLLVESKDYYRIDRMIVSMIILGGIGWFLIEVMKYIELKLSLWKIGEVSG
jgi:ABC-type nitrate/sulfonate/bicarbonate transport system permease component